MNELFLLLAGKVDYEKVGKKNLLAKVKSKLAGECSVALLDFLN